MPVATDLRKQRADIIMKARAMVNAADFDAERSVEVDRMFADADALQARIKQAERAEQMAVELGQEIARDADRTGTNLRDAGDARERAKAQERRLFVAYALGDLSRLSSEDTEVLAKRMRVAPQAAGSIGTNTAGGYTVSPDFMRELLIAQKAWDGVRQVARVVGTDTGVDLPWPTMDDTANVATIVGENTAGAAGTDLVFGSKTLKSWTYRSGYLPISIELLQDSAFDFDTLVRDALAVRFGRGQNAHFTTGNGTSQPEGIAVGGALGKTGTTGQTTSVITDDLIDLEHSVDPAYRQGSVFMMHDSSFKVVKKLKDSQNRPLFLPGFESNAVDTILGYPVVINQDVASMAANAKSIFFGNFRNYVIRDVMELRITRLNERFAENGQVAWIAFQRTDGRLVSAASPIKWYANSGT